MDVHIWRLADISRSTRLSPLGQMLFGLMFAAIGGAWLWFIRSGLLSWLSTVSWRKRPPPRWSLLTMAATALVLALVGIALVGAGLVRLLA